MKHMSDYEGALPEGLVRCEACDVVTDWEAGGAYPWGNESVEWGAGVCPECAGVLIRMFGPVEGVRHYFPILERELGLKRD